VTDWRYTITYFGRFTSESTDEERLRLEALQAHIDVVYQPNSSHIPLVEVEAIDNAGN
jgi:hypothetical protein